MDDLWVWMESDLNVIMVGPWMLCGNGWSLSGRYHGWPVDVHRNDESLRKNRNSNKQTASNTYKCSQNGPSSIKRAKKSSNCGTEKSNIATHAKSAKKQKRNTHAENKCSKPEENARCRTKTSKKARTKRGPKRASGRRVSQLAETTK